MHTNFGSWPGPIISARGPRGHTDQGKFTVVKYAIHSIKSQARTERYVTGRQEQSGQDTEESTSGRHNSRLVNVQKRPIILCQKAPRSSNLFKVDPGLREQAALCPVVKDPSNKGLSCQITYWHHGSNSQIRISNSLCSWKRRIEATNLLLGLCLNVSG